MDWRLVTLCTSRSGFLDTAYRTIWNRFCDDPKHIVRVLEDAAKPPELRGRPVREDVKGERH